MNEYDSARMADVLRESAGYEPTDEPAEADLLLLNTCSVREKAQEKVFSLLGQWRLLKLERPEVITAAAGAETRRSGPSEDCNSPSASIRMAPLVMP
jgi:tRNA-2-methylthio-N6-dimethylallyladenosine synthase